MLASSPRDQRRLHIHSEHSEKLGINMFDPITTPFYASIVELVCSALP
jgi:hypothetical protein